MIDQSPIEYITDAVLACREFCGNEAEALADAVADYKAENQCDFPFNIDQRAEVMRRVNERWNEYRREAGVEGA